jgi:peroxiredoxin
MGFESVFVDMVDKYYRTGQAVWADSVTLFKIKDKAGKLKPLLIGKKAPNLTLKDTSGVYQTLYNFRNDFVVLAFWDPDCSHCKKEIPVLLKEYNEKLKKRNLEVFAVCTEAERNKWTDFIRKEKLNWVNVADIELQNPFRTLYDIHSTPVIYVLDKNKMILAKRIPVEKIDEFLERHITLESRKKTK